MVCKSRTILLLAIGIFVLSLATSASAGELMNDALASIERSSPELAGAFEKILSLPEIQELASVVEAFFQEKNKDKQQYNSICEFLDNLNQLADDYEDQHPKAVEWIISELEAVLPSLYLSASFPFGEQSGPFNSENEEVYFCDENGKCPSWYYHFLRGTQIN